MNLKYLLSLAIVICSFEVHARHHYKSREPKYRDGEDRGDFYYVGYSNWTEYCSYNTEKKECDVS